MPKKKSHPVKSIKKPIQKKAAKKNLSAKTKPEALPIDSLLGELRLRDLLFSSLSKATRELLLNPDWNKAIGIGLQMLGEATQVDRVYLFENDPIKPGTDLSCSQRYEWNSGVAEPQIDNPELQNLPYTLIAECYQPLKDNRPFFRIVREMNKYSSFRKILEDEDIKSIILFPIFVQEGFWGFIGFDECKYERQWSEIEFSVLRSYSATIAGVLGRKLSEQEVSEKNKFIESFAATSPDIIYVYDIDTDTNVFENRHIAKILGYSPEQIKTIGSNYWNFLMHPDDKKKYDDLLNDWHRRTDNDSEILESEYRLKNSQGEWRWYLARDTVYKRKEDGTIAQVIGTAQDITEQKLAIQALQESEQRFRMLQRASFGGISLHDRGVIIDCNQGLCDITGYSFEELIGMNGLKLFAPESQAVVIEHIRSRYDKPYDAEGIRKDGSRYFLEIHGKNIPYHGREIRVTEFRDITDRKRSEGRIREQNARLIAITEDLKRKNDQLEEFAQIVSHNLRAPIGNILSLITFYEDATTEDERKEYFNLLKESGQTVHNTFNELVEVLKIRQNPNIERHQLSFASTLEKVKKMLAARINETQAVIKEEFGTPYILYPNIYLESILLNLLSNSLKYKHKDRIPTIRFRTFQENGHTILEVIDNGLGINLEKYGHQVFKLKKTFHEHPESRGIGLFITKNQIEALGGEIKVRSKEFEGATFVINFSKYAQT
ncbi:MAG: PAS domain S-box protein [Flammeovirgaceae bacterium]|nr:PAS domain S-box protein [Flammeovirgaceae bacterium]